MESSVASGRIIDIDLVFPLSEEDTARLSEQPSMIEIMAAHEKLERALAHREAGKTNDLYDPQTGDAITEAVGASGQVVYIFDGFSLFR